LIKWDDISRAHLKLDIPQKLPSGQSFIHNKPGFRYPAATKLDSSNAVCDALVGVRLWTNPQVLRECDILLGLDDDEIKRLVANIKVRLVEGYKKAYKVLIKEKQNVYGDNSYFRKIATVSSDLDSSSQ
jgi:hypothetical protein